MIAGKIVQINSITCPSNRYRLLYLLKNNLLIKYPTRIVIMARISIAWSWKNSNCSINGDELSCKEYIFHVAISKKK